MEHLSLLTGGQEHSRSAWEKAAADVLRKAGRLGEDDPDERVWEALTRRTLEGIAVPPLGTPALVRDLPDPGDPGRAPFTRGAALSRPEEGWDIRVHLADPDPRQAAADALTDLENGATSLWLTLGRGGLALADLPAVLAEVFLDLAPVALDCPEDPVGAAEAFARLVDERGVTPHPDTVLAVDPLSAALRGHPGEADLAATVGRLAELAGGLGTRALTVDASAAHDLGGHDAHALGLSLAAGAAVLRLLTEGGTRSVADAAALLEFRFAVSDEQLTAIATLRAARRLWARVLELSGAPEAPGQVQHAVSARAMLTKYDPWVNILRGTVAGFAAGVGGAAAVTVLPFDSVLGLPDALGRRVARNTSSLLIHEAHVARVTDPAGGSFAVEKLTDDLAAAGWEQFQRIEREGGLAAFLDREPDGLRGWLRAEAAEPRAAQVATRRRAVTGVSEFPHLEETLPERRPLPEGAPGAERYAAPFEALRDAPAATPVFLATLGTVAQHTARATFAANLLAAGGVDTVGAGATSGPEDLVRAYREAGERAERGPHPVASTVASPVTSPVVCLAGADATYAEWGAAAVGALRDAGAAYVVLAGKPGERTVPADLVDDHCALGIDALAFLTRIREELAR